MWGARSHRGGWGARSGRREGLLGGVAGVYPGPSWVSSKSLQGVSGTDQVDKGAPTRGWW